MQTRASQKTLFKSNIYFVFQATPQLPPVSVLEGSTPFNKTSRGSVDDNSMFSNSVAPHGNHTQLGFNFPITLQSWLCTVLHI